MSSPKSIEEFKKGGKIKQKQKQKQKQTVNIKNIITIDKKIRRNVARKRKREEPQPPVAAKLPNGAATPMRYFQPMYQKLFSPPQTSFRSVVIGNPNSTSDNVSMTEGRVEEIVNGRIKQLVKQAIDRNEMNRVNKNLDTNFDNIYGNESYESAAAPAALEIPEEDDFGISAPPYTSPTPTSSSSSSSSSSSYIAPLGSFAALPEEEEKKEYKIPEEPANKIVKRIIKVKRPKQSPHV